MKRIRIDCEGALENKGQPKEVFDRMTNYITELQSKSDSITYIEIGIQFAGTFRKVLPLLRKKDYAIGIDLFEELVHYTGAQTHGHFYSNYDDIIKLLDNLGFNRKQYLMLKGDSAQIIPTISMQEIAYTFIDANHTFEACKTDVIEINKKVNRGYFQIHDTNNKRWGTLRVSKEIAPKLNWKLENTDHNSYYFSKGL
jgi:hypothetical protein